MWIVDVGIPILNDLEKSLNLSFEIMDGRHCISSGAGFGFRDLQLEFKTEEEADKVAEEVQKLLLRNGYRDSAYSAISNNEEGLPDFYVTVYEDEEDIETLLDIINP